MGHTSGPPGSAPVDTSLGQRVTSALVDIAFFVVVGILGWKRVLSEPLLGALLGSYASARFGIAYGKQQTVVALAAERRRDYYDGGGGGPPGSGGSGDRFSALRPPPQQERRPANPPIPRQDPPYKDPYSRRAPLPVPSTSPIMSLIRAMLP